MFEHHWSVIMKDREMELKNPEYIFDETSETCSMFYRTQIKDFGNKERDYRLLNPNKFDLRN